MNSVFFEEVFHPSDFSEGDAGAFSHALRLALAAKGRLTLLHVHDSTEEAHWSEFPSVRRLLAQWGIIAPDAPPEALLKLELDVKKIQREGRKTAASIAGYTIEHGPDLLVLATHQRQGLKRLLHPSIAVATAERSRIMTLFVPRQTSGFVSRETGSVRLRNVLIPIDRSPDFARAVEAAYALCRILAAAEVHFTFLHVGQREDAPSFQAPSQPGWTSELTVWEGSVVEHILSTSETQDCDLIVMATRSHHGLLGAIQGSTTARVLRSAKCPVLAVPTGD